MSGRWTPPEGALFTLVGQVEWTGLNDATGPPTVKSKLSATDASYAWGSRQGTCPVTAQRYLLSLSYRSGTLYP
jgi:hypothetical protein